MRNIIVIISLLAFLLILQPVLAQNIAQNYPQFPFSTWYSPEALATFLGVPSQWLVIPQVIYYIIIPFIVAMTVTYGILTELGIFRRSFAANKINIVISFAMAFSLLPSGMLTVIVTYFYAFNTFVGLIGFGFLFFVGVIMWVYGTSHRIWGEQVPASIRHSRELQKEINELLQKERRLDNQIANAGRNKQLQRQQDLMGEREKIREKLKDRKERLDNVRYGE